MFFFPRVLVDPEGRPIPPKTPDKEDTSPGIRLVFCPKPGCGCTYINQCPMHGVPDAQQT